MSNRLRVKIVLLRPAPPTLLRAAAQAQATNAALTARRIQDSLARWSIGDRVKRLTQLGRLTENAEIVQSDPKTD
jgi:hypothetical protein